MINVYEEHKSFTDTCIEQKITAASIYRYFSEVWTNDVSRSIGLVDHKYTEECHDHFIFRYLTCADYNCILEDILEVVSLSDEDVYKILIISMSRITNSINLWKLLSRSLHLIHTRNLLKHFFDEFIPKLIEEAKIKEFAYLVDGIKKLPPDIRDQYMSHLYDRLDKPTLTSIILEMSVQE